VTSQKKVETLRKPSTGLKPIFGSAEWGYPAVETLRKPSTGLKPKIVVRIEVSLESRHSENPARD